MSTASLAKRRAAARIVSTGLDPVERRYVRALRTVARDAAAEYVRALASDVKAMAREDSASSKIQELRVMFEVALAKVVGPLFDRHARDVVRVNALALRSLGVRSITSLGIGEEVAKRRQENVDLVVQAHRAYADSVQDIFTDPESFGLRVEVLQARLLERGDVSESRAELIARDQTLKLNGQITQLRQTGAGVSEYIWSTSRDERVRDSHRVLEGQRFSWSSPPEVGHPGEDYQCRCVALPVIEDLEGL
jgi:SPP1 gp7 family putative phage head morphogenesis protein